MPKSLLSVRNLKMHFPIYGGLFKKQVAKVHAVDGVNLDIKAGETLGLVGESGCGKSTLGRTVLKLYKATAGEIYFDDQNISHLNTKEMRPVRSQLQVIFQDPYESLNSRHTIGRILEEPLIIHQFQHDYKNNKEYILDLLKKVGLPTSAYERYPHEFSGGQRQRIGIARAIALRPKLIICDEPVSALDVSIQSQIMNLLMDLQKEMGLAFLFIAHDLRSFVIFLIALRSCTSDESWRFAMPNNSTKNLNTLIPKRSSPPSRFPTPQSRSNTPY